MTAGDHRHLAGGDGQQAERARPQRRAVGEDAGSKLARAEKLKIRILDEDTFDRLAAGEILPEPEPEPELVVRALEVEGLREDLAGQFAQLGHRAGPRKRRAADVPADVEAGIVGPDRVVEAERGAGHALAEARHQTEPALDVGDQVVERGRLSLHHDRGAHVDVDRAALGQERRHVRGRETIGGAALRFGHCPRESIRDRRTWRNAPAGLRSAARWASSTSSAAAASARAPSPGGRRSR